MPRVVSDVFLKIGSVEVMANGQFRFKATQKRSNVHQDALARVLRKIAKGEAFQDALGNDVVLKGKKGNQATKIIALNIALTDYSEGLLKLEILPESSQNGSS